MFLFYYYQLKLSTIKTILTSLVIFGFVMLFVEKYKYEYEQLLNNNGIENNDLLLSNGNYASIDVPGNFLKYYAYSTDSNNQTYCNFNYGLPDNFKYKIFDIKLSPQLGVNSSYRVLYNVIKYKININDDLIPQVTYCTHATPEYLFHFSEIVRLWDGPISLSVYIPNYDAQIAINYLNQLCHCMPQMYKVSVHFVFPADNTPNLHDEYKYNTNECIVPAGYNNIKTFRSKHYLEYPVNVARNVARVGAKTKYLLVSDVELIPSYKLASKFMTMSNKIKFDSYGNNLNRRKTFNGRIVSKKSYYIIKSSDAQFRHVYVIPVFEVEKNEKVPRTKYTLRQMYTFDKIVYFHRYVCIHCQRFPEMQKWLSELSDYGSVKPFLLTKRQVPYHRWEPIFIGTNDDPFYSEELSWEGFEDKMAQMMEMCLLEYHFIILDNAFLVHLPGIKRTRNNNILWRRPFQIRNSEAYREIVKKLRSNYRNLKRCHG